MFKDFFSSCVVVDVPADVRGDGIIVTESVKTLGIDTRSDLAIVGLAGEFSVVLAKVVVDVMNMLAVFDIVVVTGWEFTERLSLEDPLSCFC